MKSFSAVTAAVLLFAASWAQAQTQPAANSTPAASSVSKVNPTAGKNSFFVVAEFTESLNAKKLKPGDKVKAEVTQDVLLHGRILIPVESKLLGHVTEANGRTKEDQESRLGIVFDKILLKHHRAVGFQGIIQSLEAPAPRRSRVDEPDQMLPPAVMGVSSNGGMTPMGGGPTHGPSTPSAGSLSGTTASSLPGGAPVFVDGTPGSNAGNSTGGDLGHPSGGRSAVQPASPTPLGAGMPLGVFGIKGINLTPGPTSSTPGPVITSPVRDVKLEYGTQVLVKVSDPHVTNP